MQGQDINPGRGLRLRQAIEASGHRKLMALASELGVSAAALSKWIQGHTMSVEHACKLAGLLDVSLDWLLMGRNAPAWLQQDQLSATEIELIDGLRHRPSRVTRLMQAIILEIPRSP
jgi:transcriptional regulator with XRE-family HTH domain